MPSVFNHVYEGVQAYATSDLFEPHPTKSGYWKVYGRTDDQITDALKEFYSQDFVARVRHGGNDEVVGTCCL